MDVNGNISTLANAKDPFKDWPPATAAAMAQLKAIQDALAAIKDKTITVTVNTVNTGVMSVSTGSNGVQSVSTTPSTGLAPFDIAGAGISTIGDYMSGVTNSGLYSNPGSGVSTIGDYLAKTNNNGLYANPGNGISTIGDYQASHPITVNVQIDGTAITNTLVNNSASGIPTTMNRSGYFSGLTAV
jgi:hypothetical protein